MSTSAGRVLIIPKGEYNASTTYSMLDLVTYHGSSYVCKQTSTGNLPTNTTYWQLSAQGNGSGGHTIKDSTGTSMTQRDGLQFEGGLTVSDDSTNDKTIVSASGLLSNLSELAIKSGSYNRGKDITSYVTDGTMWDRIAGTNGFEPYEDIMPWDYIDLGKTITAPSSGGGSTTGTNIVRVAQRGGINPYQFGLTSDKPCLVLVPETHFGMSYMNSTNVTTGGYKGSAMHTTILPNINSQLETTNLAGHILTTTELLSNTVVASAWGKLGSASGASSNWEWVSGQKCVLMSEMEVYGGTVFSSSGFDTGNACMQFEAFKNSKDAAMPYPIYFWLKDVASSAHFCNANGPSGHANYTGASHVLYVRPRFIIA